MGVQYALASPRASRPSTAKYIDKNYAGTLIIWDRLFGSFVAEEEEPVYGIVKPLESWNPLWANFHRWVAMFNDAAAQRPLGRPTQDLVHAAGLAAAKLTGQSSHARSEPRDNHFL